MPTIMSVRRLEGRESAYEVTVEWSEGVRAYEATISEEAGIRMLHSRALEQELSRCPPLLKHVAPLVFQLHDGNAVTLPVTVETG